MLQQLIANGIIAASVYILVGLAFLVSYSTTRFFDFAYGILFALAAYCTYFLVHFTGLPILISSLLATVTCIVVAIAVQILVYRPLKRKCASPLVLLLVSLGIYVLLQNCVSLAFGDDTKTIRPGSIDQGINLLGATLTRIQMDTISIAAVASCLLAVFLMWTRLGTSMRAVASDPELASVSGVSPNRVVLSATAISSALVGIAGILTALDVDMVPTMGLRALVMGIVAYVVGGVGSVAGVVLGGLLLGTSQHLGLWRIGSQWQDAIAFVILITFLLLKPKGFLGKQIKSEVA